MRSVIDDFVVLMDQLKIERFHLVGAKIAGTIARRFADLWIWFEGGPKEDAAVEADRYERYGYPVSPANVRSVLALSAIVIRDGYGTSAVR